MVALLKGREGGTPRRGVNSMDIEYFRPLFLLILLLLLLLVLLLLEVAVAVAVVVAEALLLVP